MIFPGTEAERWFMAAMLDQCPPDRAFYLCMSDEAESTIEIACAACWLAFIRNRSATKNKPLF